MVMPRKPMKPCAFPWYPNITFDAYCEEYAVLRQKQYDKFNCAPNHDKKYGKNWKWIRGLYDNKHPTWFNEETDLGTKLYEQLKKEHPQYFIDEEAKEIEDAKIEAEKKDPQEITNELLLRLNENLEKMNKLQEEKE